MTDTTAMLALDRSTIVVRIENSSKRFCRVSVDDMSLIGVAIHGVCNGSQKQAARHYTVYCIGYTVIKQENTVLDVSRPQ